MYKRQLPYKIVPGEIATYRDSIFLERAVVGERLRVAMGMSLRKVTELSLIHICSGQSAWDWICISELCVVSLYDSL